MVLYALVLTKGISTQTALSKFPDQRVNGITRTSGEIDFRVRLISGIEISQSTPSMLLAVSSFSLDVANDYKKNEKKKKSRLFAWNCGLNRSANRLHACAKFDLAKSSTAAK